MHAHTSTPDPDPRRPLTDLLCHWTHFGTGALAEPQNAGTLTARLGLRATPLVETYDTLCRRWAGVALADAADTIARMGASRPADYADREEEWEALASAGETIGHICAVLGAEAEITAAIYADFGVVDLTGDRGATESPWDAEERAVAEAMVSAAEWAAE